jgi:hypothetical protein
MTSRAVAALLLSMMAAPVLAANEVAVKADVAVKTEAAIKAEVADKAQVAADRRVVGPAIAGDVDWSLPPVEFGPVSRGGVLPALYCSYAALQVYDAYTTISGVRRGAQEGNAVVSGLAANSAAVWSLKAGVTVSSVLLAEHLWKQRRRGQAIVVMLAANGIMAGVAARNAAVLRTVR